MTSRERVLAAIAREVPDRVPVDISWGLTPLVKEVFRQKTGQTDYLAYFGVDTRHARIANTQCPHDFSSYFAEHADGERMRIGEWGIGSVPLTDSDLHFQRVASPLKNARSVGDVADFPLPDITADYRMDLFRSQVKEFISGGFAACGPMTNTLFETAWQIRGHEEFFMDMLERPDMTECLLDRLTALRVRQARLFAEAGVDVLMLGDDVAMQTGMMMHPDLWRTWFKPRLAAIIDAARGVRPGLPVFYHSDGNPTAIIDDLIEIGVTILNPVQPECVDPAALKEKYGDRLAFWGTMGIQHTLPFGTPADVCREVKTRIETVGKGGGLLLGPSHMIEPEVPWENLAALYEAVKKYGSYRL